MCSWDEIAASLVLDFQGGDREASVLGVVFPGGRRQPKVISFDFSRGIQIYGFFFSWFVRDP